MTKSKKLRGLTVAALAATALFAAQPAAAETVTLNGYWAGHDSANHISFSGIDWHTGSFNNSIQNDWVGAGGFSTTFGGSTVQSFCVDIFHTFSAWPTFPALPGTLLNSTVMTDLGRLYTQHHSLIDSHSSTAGNEAAFQLAVWEIVNEGTTTPGGAYDIYHGAFTASHTADADLAQSFLDTLGGASSYYAKILDVQSGQVGNKGPQDVVVYTPVPEPQTYAMMLVGLGLLGFSARRKNQNLS